MMMMMMMMMMRMGIDKMKFSTTEYTSQNLHVAM